MYYPGMEFELPLEETRNQGEAFPCPNNTCATGAKMAITRVDNFQGLLSELAVDCKVLLKFEAEWCSPCKAMSPAVEELANQNPDLKVIAVDIEGDGMEEALTHYKVFSVPTFVHVRNGETVRSASGTVSKAELRMLVEDDK